MLCHRSTGQAGFPGSCERPRRPGVAFTLHSFVPNTLSFLIAYNSTNDGYFHGRRSEAHVRDKESAIKSNRKGTRFVMSIAGGDWRCRIEG